MTKTEKALFALLALIMLAYVGTRAYLNPLINDEAYTFLYFIWSDKFIPFDTLFWSANNHPVNSALTWACSKTLGIEEWALRVPNVLALALFALYGFKIGTRLQSVWVRWCFWVCLFATPYLLELFGYSRGYGLSIAFFTAAIWYFIKALESQKLLMDWQTWLFMTLAMFSNLNLINSYFIWILLFAFFSFRNTPRLKWILHISIRSSLLLIPILMGLQLKAHNQLFFGASSFTETFNTVIEVLFGSVPVYGLFVLISLLALISIGFIYTRLFSNPTIEPAYFIFGSFLLFNILGSLIQFWLLDIILPKERTAIHWYIPFVGSLFFLLDALHLRHPKKADLLAACSLLIPIAQLGQYNLYSASTYDWKLEQFSDSYYEAIQTEQVKTNALLSLESNVLFNKHVYDNLNMKNGSQLNDLQHRRDITDTEADIVLISDSLHQYPQKTYDTLVADISNGTALLKKRSTSKAKLIYKHKISSPENIENQRYPLARLNIDTLSGSNLQFLVDVNITASTTPHLLYTTIELKDSTGEIIATEQIEITPLKLDWTQSKPIKFTFTWYNIPTSATLAEVYIWNYRLPYIAVQSAGCAIYKYQDSF